MKYEILVDCDFFDSWTDRFKKWKKQTTQKEFNQDMEFLASLIENFLLTTERNKVIVGKYNNFDTQVYNGYINYIKNQIYKLLPLLEERGEWRKHLDTIITEITGTDAIFSNTINFISLLSKLETLKQCPDFPPQMTEKEIKEQPEFILFRKTIFESMNIAENLTLAGDQQDE